LKDMSNDRFVRPWHVASQSCHPYCVPSAETFMSSLSLTETLSRYREQLMRLPGVEGVAEGEMGGQPCIRVLISRHNIELPDALEGYPVYPLFSGGLTAT
jgi:hypothetical protein